MDGGSTESPRFTVLSTPPAAVTAPENPPAHKKIRLIVMIFSSPIPAEITFILSANVNFPFCKNAVRRAIKNATIAGIA